MFILQRTLSIFIFKFQYNFFFFFVSYDFCKFWLKTLDVIKRWRGGEAIKIWILKWNIYTFMYIHAIITKYIWTLHTEKKKTFVKVTDYFFIQYFSKNFKKKSLKLYQVSFGYIVYVLYTQQFKRTKANMIGKIFFL